MSVVLSSTQTQSIAIPIQFHANKDGCKLGERARGWEALFKMMCPERNKIVDNLSWIKGPTS